jgi:hypothetical protein
MGGRIIVTGSRLTDSVMAQAGAFSSVIDLGEGPRPLDGGKAGRLAEEIRSLSTDGFRQTNQVCDLSGLPCWVVDRNITAAAGQFSADELAGIPYDCYIPSSLVNNWVIFTETYRQMVSQWEEIEAAIRSGGKPKREELGRALDLAVHVFCIAVTVERYYEIAIALSTIGMAHQGIGITGKLDVIVTCYGHAAQCAQWSGGFALRTFLADAYSKLKEEAAARAAKVQAGEAPEG